MGLMIGMGRPLYRISRPILGAAMVVMQREGVSEDVIDQHLDNFASLMLWAEGLGFVDWADRL
jgi:hypothetical protein